MPPLWFRSVSPVPAKLFELLPLSFWGHEHRRFHGLILSYLSPITRE
jgi:hypothetical protein